MQRAANHHIFHVANLPFNLGFLIKQKAASNGPAFHLRIY